MELNALQRYDADLLAGHKYLIGVDEAGRGALAGPVVAAACVFECSFFESHEAVALSARINDSKQLRAGARDLSFKQIEHLRSAGLLDFAAAAASVPEIAELNILGATRLAMRRAVEELAQRTTNWVLPEAAAAGPLFSAERAVKLAVDGRALKPFPYTHQGIVKGDSKSLAIAMASIVAKVTRDRELLQLATQYPEYGFDQHKGYATQGHRRAILAQGAVPVHRERFLRNLLASKDASPHL